MEKFILFWVVVWILICGLLITLTELSRKESKFNCSLLMGGWHPDAPHKFNELCNLARKEKNDR
jgi:hypothetical protein